MYKTSLRHLCHKEGVGRMERKGKEEKEKPESNQASRTGFLRLGNVDIWGPLCGGCLAL